MASTSNEQSKRQITTGYDCSFVNNPPENVQSDCPVCLLIVRDPHQVTCCGYSFCQVCIQRIKTDKKPCPTCNTEDITDFPDKRLARSLISSKVRCSHQKEGCGWMGELGQLDKHLNKNPKLNKRLNGCEFTEVKCSYCQDIMFRQQLNVHQNNVCGKRPVTCKYCSEYKSDFDDVVGNHLSVCPRYTLKCPNDCGAFPERQNMEDHMNLHCPRTEINCDFFNVGCQKKFARNQKSSHLENAMSTHLSLIAASHSELTLSHANLSTSVTQLQAANYTLKEQLQESHGRNETLSKTIESMTQTEMKCQAGIKQLQERLSKGQKTHRERNKQQRQELEVTKRTHKNEMDVIRQKRNKERTEQQRQELEAMRIRHKNEIDDIKQKNTELRNRLDQQTTERVNKSTENDRTIPTLQTPPVIITHCSSGRHIHFVIPAKFRCDLCGMSGEMWELNDHSCCFYRLKRFAHMLSRNKDMLFFFFLLLCCFFYVVYAHIMYRQ